MAQSIELHDVIDKETKGTFRFRPIGGVESGHLSYHLFAEACVDSSRIRPPCDAVPCCRQGQLVVDFEPMFYGLLLLWRKDTKQSIHFALPAKIKRKRP